MSTEEETFEVLAEEETTETPSEKEITETPTEEEATEPLTAEETKQVIGALEEILTNPETNLDDDFERAARLMCNVAMGMLGRYKENKDIDDLENAISLFEKGTNHPTAMTDPGFPNFLNNYAWALISRFGRNNDDNDLQKAIELGKTALRKADPDAPDYDEILGLVSDCFLAMFEEADSADALREVIVYGMEALESISSMHPRRPDLFHLLSRCHYKRYELANETADINHAIEYAGEAIQLSPEEANEKLASYFFLISNCLCSRSSNQEDPAEDIEWAIQCGEESVERTRNIAIGAGENLARRLVGLSACYWAHTIAGKEKVPKDLDKAFSAATEACDLIKEMESPGADLRPMALASLARCFSTRFDRQNSWEDLRESISLSYGAINCGSGGGIDDLTFLNELAFLADRLLFAFKHSLEHSLPPTDESIIPGSNYLDESIKQIHRVMQIPHPNASERITAAIGFTNSVLEFEPEQRIQIFGRLDRLLSHAVELLPQATLRPLSGDQMKTLSDFSDLASNAAAASLEAGNDPYEALRLLELGRSVLISMQLDAQMPIPELYNRHRQLAEEYIMLQDQLQRSKIAEEPFEIRHKITTKLRSLLTTIRQESGFEVFGQTIGKEQMMELADRGPIVVLNVSAFRCDALAVLRNEIKVINLPDLDMDFLFEESWGIQHQLAAIKDSQKDFHLLHKNLTQLLKTTWRQVLSPVLKTLGFTTKPRDEKDWPHVWWILTGDLCLVPVHAAGIPGKATVMDRVVSSYIPSIKALAHARAKHKNFVSQQQAMEKADGGNMRALVIAMAETPGRTPLDHSQAEAKAVADAFPNTHVLEQPTRDTVMKELENPPSIVHFSCHGETSYDDPTESKLLLSDWQISPLNVSQLQRLSLKGSQLAYLSACYAAHGGDLHLRNENLSLASSCQLAGFPSAIGSFWYVGQDASLKVVEKFYKVIGEDGFDLLDVGRAFHFAVLGLRESTKSVGNDFKGDPVRWAPFVHYGI